MLTGAGGNFSSGANLSGGLSGSAAADARPVIEPMRAMGDILLRLQSLPKPTIAKVDGVAVGVGLGLAMACDLIVASDRARFCEIFTRRGLALDGGNSWTLPRSVGLRKAKELAYFADMVSADEAERIGLINKVVPAAMSWTAWPVSGPPALRRDPLSRSAIRSECWTRAFRAALLIRWNRRLVRSRGSSSPLTFGKP